MKRRVLYSIIIGLLSVLSCSCGNQSSTEKEQNIIAVEESTVQETEDNYEFQNKAKELGNLTDQEFQKQQTANANAQAEARPERKGFDVKTNKTMNFGGIKFQLPNYFVVEDSDPYCQTFTAEDSHNRSAFITTYLFEDIETTKDGFYDLSDRLMSSFVEELGAEKYSVIDSIKEINGFPAKVMVLGGDFDDSPYMSICSFFYQPKAHNVVVFSFVETLNTEYSYKDDYLQILYSVESE